MARRPSHKHGIKRGRLCAWPADIGTPADLAAKVTYTANPKHKTYPTSAGPPAWRSDSAKCDQFPESAWPRLAIALKRGIEAGIVSDFRGKFPFRVWVWINDVLHEARLTNAATGDYHGFPIDDPNQYPEPVEHLEAAPRVQIPIV